MPKSRPFEERLWEKIDKRGPDDCWPWLGYAIPKGYGHIGTKTNGKFHMTYAHRAVLSLTKGEPPDSKAQALHSCDNPGCCNPTHLSWGTESKNRREARDRLHNQGRQKLKPEQVQLIRADPRIYRLIAADYGVHLDTIARIKQGRSWHSA